MRISYNKHTPTDTHMHWGHGNQNNTIFFLHILWISAFILRTTYMWRARICNCVGAITYRPISVFSICCYKFNTNVISSYMQHTIEWFEQLNHRHYTDEKEKNKAHKNYSEWPNMHTFWNRRSSKDTIDQAVITAAALAVAFAIHCVCVQCAVSYNYCILLFCRTPRDLSISMCMFHAATTTKKPAHFLLMWSEINRDRNLH